MAAPPSLTGKNKGVSSPLGANRLLGLKPTGMKTPSCQALPPPVACQGPAGGQRAEEKEAVVMGESRAVPEVYSTVSAGLDLFLH